MVIHQLRLTSTLSDAQARAVLENGAARCRETPGLLQAYYAREQDTGELCAVYLFESHESLQAFEASEFGRSIAADSIQAETYEVLFPLHAERGSPTRLAI